MEYKLNTTNYRDFKVIEDNKLAGRAYFIPYSKKEMLCAVDLKHERTDSDLVEVLSGEWDFKYYNDISLIPEVFDASGVEFDKIHVPSTWQRTGYEPPVYLNCPYEFDLPNPNVPEHMSAGIYRKTFEVTNSDDVHILSFLGVVPCVDLYVNGIYVGYSEGAHNSAEFDISEFIYEGTNELLRTHRAEPLCRAADALEILGIGAQTAAPEQQRFDPAAVSPDAQQVYAALKPTPQGIDALCAATRLPAGRVLAACTELELMGGAQAQPGRRYIAL